MQSTKSLKTNDPVSTYKSEKAALKSCRLDTNKVDIFGEKCRPAI
jgi:hypothetical protein